MFMYLDLRMFTYFNLKRKQNIEEDIHIFFSNFAFVQRLINTYEDIFKTSRNPVIN